MAKAATHLVAFWDGESRGTKHMIDIAKSLDLTVRVFNYQGECTLISQSAKQVRAELGLINMENQDDG
jgi:hypothetical protein